MSAQLGTLVPEQAGAVQMTEVVTFALPSAGMEDAARRQMAAAPLVLGQSPEEM